MPGMRYQPQGLIRLGTSPLRRGLVAYMPLSSPSRGDIADGVAWTSGGTMAMDTAPRGVGLRIKAVNTAYVSRPIASVLGTGAAQPITFRYRIYFHALPTTSLMSWGSTAQDGAPRYYARLSSVSGGTLNFYFAGSYHYAALVQAEREYIITHTFDGTTHSTYLNGALIGTSAGSWSGNAANLYLGIGYDGVQSTSDFLISDFAAWNRALSAAEVVSDAQMPWQLFADPYEDEEIVVPAAVVTPPTGTIPSILAGATCSAQGSITNAGALSSSMAGVSFVASGSTAAQPTGTYAATLGGASINATGAILNNGQFSSALSGITLAATGAIAQNVSGAINCQLSGVSAFFSSGQNAGTGTGTRPYRWRVLRRHFTGQQ